MIAIGYYEINNFIIKIISNDNCICNIKLVNSISEEVLDNEIIKFKKQLDEYFSSSRKTFDVNYKIEALPFRTKLFNLIMKIEFGKTCNTKSLLNEMGLTKGVSAISYGIYDNPLIILIPCHRVNTVVRRLILHKYSCDFKQFLLNLESKYK